MSYHPTTVYEDGLKCFCTALLLVGTSMAVNAHQGDLPPVGKSSFRVGQSCQGQLEYVQHEFTTPQL